MRFADQVAAENNTAFQENTFQITASSHAFKILSDSLYQNKELAVIRELACNAKDAHVDAGIPDVPIKITLPCELDAILVIADQGKGMSRDKLERLYTTYFESTKRDSDDDIGGFGLGSKSPFALTDNFTVTSTTPDGESTTILAYLDNGIPKVMVTNHEEGTDLPQGTEVRVTIPESRIDELIQVIYYNKRGIFDYWETFPEITLSGFATDNQKLTVSAAKENQAAKQKFSPLITADNLYVTVEDSTGYNDAYKNCVIVYGGIQYDIPEKLFRRLELEELIFNNMSVVIHIKLQTLIELSPSREYIEDCEQNAETLQQVLDSISYHVRRGLRHKLKKSFISFVRNLEKTSYGVDSVKHHKTFLAEFDAINNIPVDSLQISKLRQEKINVYSRLLQTDADKNLINAIRASADIFAIKIFGHNCEKFLDIPTSYRALREIRTELFSGPFISIIPEAKKIEDNSSPTFFNDITKVYLVTHRISVNYRNEIRDFESKVEKEEPTVLVLSGEHFGKETLYLKKFYPNIEVVRISKKFLNEYLDLDTIVIRTPAKQIEIAHIGFLGFPTLEVTKANCGEIKGHTFYVVDFNKHHFCHGRMMTLYRRYPNLKVIHITAKSQVRKTKYFQKFIENNKFIYTHSGNPFDTYTLPVHLLEQDKEFIAVGKVLKFLDGFTNLNVFYKHSYAGKRLADRLKYFVNNRKVRRFKEKYDIYWNYINEIDHYNLSLGVVIDWENNNYTIPDNLISAYRNMGAGKSRNPYIDRPAVYRDLHAIADKHGVFQ